MLTLWHCRLLFSLILLNFCHLYWQRRVSIFSMSCVLETSIREQQKYEKRKQTSVDNIVNDLKVWKSCKKWIYLFLLSKTFLCFFKQKYIFSYSWLEKYFLKISKNSIALVFFLPRQKLKNRYALAKPSAFVDCQSEFCTLRIMAILLKRCKRDNFEPQNFLKLSFKNIWGLHSNFVE